MLEFIKNIWNKLIPSTAFGLYFNDDFIQVIQLKGDNKNPQVKSIGQKNLEKGIIKNGEILKEKILAKEIKTLLASIKPMPIKSKKCIVSIPENQTFQHIFYLPADLKGDEFKKSLEKLIEESIPLPFYEVKYDYHTSKYGNVQVVSVAATRRLIIAQYYETLKNFAKLNPIILEPESLSLLRNIPLNLDTDSGILLIDINDDKITWFSLWSEDIFDSNSISKQEYQTNPTILINDLNKTITSFKKTTKRDIKSIVILGNQQEATALSKSLQVSIKLPVTHLNNYKITPKIGENVYPIQFKITSGLALKGIGVDIKTQINLLKK